MNALVKSETPVDAATRFASSAIRDGYAIETVHEYRDESGSALYWRIRAKKSDGAKWIRPFRFDGAKFVMGEPSGSEKGKPLYGLDRLAGDRDAFVYIVEGEACADALTSIGLVALTSGSASSAEAADWEPLRGRRVIIWPDSDSPGHAYAAAVTAKLRALSCEPLVVDVEALGLDTHGDAVDWIAANPGAAGSDVLGLAVKPANSASSENSAGRPLASQYDGGANSGNSANSDAPEALRRPVPASLPYPIPELGPILGPACESLCRVIQAPGAVCGASLLAAASLAVQGLADVEIDGRVYPTTLWMLTVAESGERKTGVDAEATRAAREFEKELTREYADAMVDFEADSEDWSARRNKAKEHTKKEVGKVLSEALRDIGPAPEPPLRPTLLVADFTAEGVTKLLMAGRPAVGVFTDEGALVLGGHSMTSESVARTAGTLCKLWDSGTLDRVRSADGPVKLWGRRLSMHLLAQPVIAERALSNDVLAGQGFLPRCLLAWPESTAGTRVYREESLRDDAAVVRYSARLGELLRRPLPITEGQRNELDPPRLHLTADAKTVWLRLYSAVEAAMAPTERYATVKAWASKTPEQALRIAGVLTLVENPAATEIDARTIERASELAIWHLHEAVRLAGTAELSPEVRDAEALLHWCHATGRNRLYSTVALQFGPPRIRERERFVIAMDALERTGWAHKIEGGLEVDGKQRKNVWRIVSAEVE